MISLLLLALVACESNTAQNTTEFKTLPVAEFKQLLEQSKNIQLLDVRTPSEYMEEHLENATNIDFNDPGFSDQIEHLDKNKSIFIYCLSGGRSNNAMNLMKSKGFTKVYNMKGGILEWKGSQYPLTKTVFNGWKGMTKEEFTKLTTGATPTLIDFRAKWCGPCKQLKPILDELAKEYAGKLQIVEIDIDENKSLADDMHITNIPLLVYYKDGKVAMNIEGFTEKKDIIAALKL